ncbi:MAG TPA: CoA transferase, partial [Tepidiformaceae bacterium]|nr:CoA transferase [Tepidiformaceae bacterium]
TELFTDPHLASRGFIQTVQHPTAGDITLMSNPLRMSASPTSLRAAPLLGQHTAEVLAADLGLTAAEVDALREEGTVA